LQYQIDNKLMTEQQNTSNGSPSAYQSIQALITNIEQVIKGKKDKIELVLTCLLAEGHILIEDNPGTGKTVLARALANSIRPETTTAFKRVQFTPDLLPMDLLGTHIFDEAAKEFIFKKGPLFCNILLADEINRASPKVQSALLECMAEGQITSGDTTYLLEDVFFTIATQNPIEMEGTYPLPAAQLDRFSMKIYFGYVDEATEMDIYSNYRDIHHYLKAAEPVISIEEIRQLREAAHQVTVHPELIRSVTHIIRATRDTKDITLGASTRAGIALMKCLRAYALIQGRNYVVEDDLNVLAPHVLQHRIIYSNTTAARNWLQQTIQTELERLRKVKL